MVKLIEAQARRQGAVLVTRNVQEFQRVSGLFVENWEDLFFGVTHPTIAKLRPVR
jgi:hypothetical protein